MIQRFNTRKITQLAALFCIGTGLIIGSFFLASYISESSVAQDIVQRFGYIGVVLIAIAAGLNTVMPMPAAVFVPIFSSAGLLFPGILIALTVGTTIADITGYLFGKLGKELIEQHYPRTFTTIQKLNTTNRVWLLMFVFTYSALAPFPNEAFIIPLAVIGIPLRIFIIPMVAGTVIYSYFTMYGVENIFRLYF